MVEAASGTRAARVLYFVRHGQYHLAEGKQQGQLTALGRRQARLLARYFAGLEIATIVSSDLARAVETANLLSRELGFSRPKRNALLREVMPCKVRGVVVPFAKRHEARERIERVMNHFFRPSRAARNEIVVCHGNLIRALVCRLTGAPPAMFQQMIAHNTGVTCFVVSPDGPRLLGYNAVSHLPMSARSVT
ncbi:MAG TPA: histidine phosphatase family protein [Polyangiaceae bacterium]|nr:histidine phosphatase family protein [Polyangiaceae bacterium]